MVTVAAVFGVALVYAPLGVDDGGDGTARFESTDGGTTDALCQAQPEGKQTHFVHGNGQGTELTLEVLCQGGELQRADLRLDPAEGEPRDLYSFEDQNEVLGVTTPTGDQEHLDVAPSDLQAQDPDSATDPVDADTPDLPEGAQVVFQLVDEDPPEAGETLTVLHVIEQDDGDLVVHLPAEASADEHGASLTVVNPAGEDVSVDTRDHVDLQDLLGGNDLPVDKGTVTGAAGDVLAIVEDASPDDDPVKLAYGTARSTYETGTSLVFDLAPSRIVVEDAGGDKIAELTLPGEDTAPGFPGADVLDVGEGTCTEVTGTLEVVRDGTCSGDIQEVRVPSAPGTGDVTSAATVEKGDDGGWTLTVGGQSHPVPGQTVHIPSTPADPGIAEVVKLLDGDGESVTEVQVKKAGASLIENVTGVDVVRMVEDAQGNLTENVTTVVGDFLVVEKNLTDMAVNATVFPGDEPGPGDLQIRKKGDEWVVETPFAVARHTGSELTVAPSASDPNTVHVLLRDEDGNTQARFDVTARGDEPGSATASYNVPAAGEDGEGSVSPPVAILGSPTDPRGVRVTGPDGTLLLYEEGEGDEATVSIPPADTTKTVHKETLRLEGNPLVDDQFVLVVEDAEDGEALRYTVNRPNWREAARETARDADAETPADLGPVVSAVDTAAGTAPDAQGEADFLEKVSDQSVALDSDSSLAGNQWISGLRNLTFEATFDDTAAYTRFYVRYADERPIPMDAPTVRLSPVDDNESHRSGTLDLPNPGSWDDTTMRFEVVAERRLPDSLFSYARVDNRTDAPFEVRIDGAAPTAEINAPSNPDDTSWLVDWDGQDAASGVTDYTVEKNIGGGGWEILKENAGSGGQAADIDAKADVPYEFRAKATDMVGHESSWAGTGEIMYESPDPDPSDDTTDDPTDDDETQNGAPSVDLLSPSRGAEVSDIVEVRWSAQDTDDTAPAVSAYVRPADGEWDSLRTQSDRAYWDTAEWPNGDYEVKVVADDGTLEAQDTVTGITVANEQPDGGDATDPASPGTTDGDGSGDGEGSQAPGGGSGTQEDGDGSGDDDGGGFPVPGPSTLAVAVAAGLAALARRRRR